MLIATRIGSWRIMLGCLLGMGGLTLLINVLNSDPGHYAAIEDPPKKYRRST